MEESFLKIIQNFILENGIVFDQEFDGIPIATYNFPEFFNVAILEELKNCKRKSDSTLGYYTLKLDSKGQAYLEIIGDRGSKIFILQNHVRYDDELTGKKIPETNFIKIAEDIEYLSNEELIRQLSPRYRESLKKVDSLQELIVKWALEYCKYIAYIYNEYLESKKPNRITLSYIEPDPINVGKNKGLNSGTTSERKNNLIPFEEREIILKGSKQLYLEGEARRDVDNVISYKVFAYKMPDQTSRLVMEPIAGNKYTKIGYIGQILNSETFYSNATFYLELNSEEATDCPSLTRHGHTTLKHFEELIGFVLDDTKPLNGLARERITEASKVASLKLKLVQNKQLKSLL